MDNHENNIDPDILKGREDIRNAKESAGENRPQNESTPEKDDRQKQKEPQKNTPLEPSQMMRAVVEANKKHRQQQNPSDVPSFDVARKVLSEQRERAAAKRTAPASKQQIRQSTQRQTTDKRQIEHTYAPYNTLISEIVAGDIEMLCRTA